MELDVPACLETLFRMILHKRTCHEPTGKQDSRQAEKRNLFHMPIPTKRGRKLLYKPSLYHNINQDLSHISVYLDILASLSFFFTFSRAKGAN